MRTCSVFWHHVGREHGGMRYTDDLRKNTSETISEFLQLRERNYGNDPSKMYVQHDEATLVEVFPPDSPENKEIIIYLIDKGLQFTLWRNKEYLWKVDIVDIYEYKPRVFCVQDWLIDLHVFSDGRYHLLDMDEFTEAMQLEILTPEQAQLSLMRLHEVTAMLNAGTFPGNRISDLLLHYRLQV